MKMIKFIDSNSSQSIVSTRMDFSPTIYKGCGLYGTRILNIRTCTSYTRMYIAFPLLLHRVPYPLRRSGHLCVNACPLLQIVIPPPPPHTHARTDINHHRYILIFMCLRVCAVCVCACVCVGNQWNKLLMLATLRFSVHSTPRQCISPVFHGTYVCMLYMYVRWIKLVMCACTLICTYVVEHQEYLNYDVFGCLRRRLYGRGIERDVSRFA